MNVEKMFENSREDVNKEIRKVLSGEIDNFNEGMKYGAKEENRVRTTICLTIADHFNKKDKALPFAVALELTHNFSLVHDDILDMGKERRGRESVWMAYGLPHGVNIGDGLLAKALNTINKNFSGNICKVLNKRLSESVIRIVESQAMDLNFKSKETQSLEDFDDLVWRKVGSLMATSAIGGAIISEQDSEKTLKPLKKFGLELGPALQVKKDIWEIENHKGREIREGKRSLVTIHALNNLEGEKRSKLLTILNKPKEETTDQEAEKAVELMKETKSVKFTKNQLKEYQENALNSLDGLQDSELAEKLKEVTKYIIENSLY